MTEKTTKLTTAEQALNQPEENTDVATEARTKLGEAIASEQEVESDEHDLYAHCPLIKAAENGDAERVRALIATGENPNMSGDPYGYYDPIMAAASKGHVETLKALIDGGGKLLESYTVHNHTPLTEAVKKGHTEMVKFLLEAGLDPNSVDSLIGFTCLLHAAGDGQTEIVKALLEAGADPNVPDTESPLFSAVAEGHTEIVKILLEARANLHHNGGLRNAVKNGHIDIVKMLLDAGAKLDLNDEHDKAALDNAREKGYAVIIELVEDKR